MTTFAFDFSAMKQRRHDYFTFVQHMASTVFQPGGSYQPQIENDPRIAYWAYPAIIEAPDQAGRDFANAVLAATCHWDQWNIFITSIIAANLMSYRDRMTPDLISRSEDHLARLVDRGDPRLPSSGANDYVFHGYNDNMPAMAVRALILSGEMLDRSDYMDHGLFKLEGLCAHFHRRGLLSEHTSSTYTPITLASLADVAEHSGHAEAREMAAACCNRILLDIFGHWHQHVGGMGGTQSRAYTADKQDWFSGVNALMWYLTGSPMCCNPIEILSDFDHFEGYGHHGRCFGFNLAQYVEVMTPSFDSVSDGVRAFCAAPRSYPYEIHATTDSGARGLYSGVKAIQTRAWHQPQYALATQSFGKTGHCLALRAVFSPSLPHSWRDRIGVWQQLAEGPDDQGMLTSHGGLPPTEIGHVQDHGHCRILQKQGSALILGGTAHSLLDRDVDQLTFSLIINTKLIAPDETIQEDKWVFLRFGDVYLGIRMIAVIDGETIQPQVITKHGYLRVLLPLIEGGTVHIDPDFLEWCDFGYCFEIAAKDECGSFATFQQECRGTTWEYYHSAYRTSRYCSRHGDLQIIDSVAAETVKFMAIDDDIEPETKLAATGLDPALTSLFPDGRRIRQRRLCYASEFIGSPFHDARTQTVVADTL